MIYVSSTNRQLTEKYVDWASQGLPNSKKLQPLEIISKTDCTKTVIFGVLRGTHLVYRWAEKNKIDFYYMDRPYWGETRNMPYYVRIAKNNHLKNWFEERPSDRFEKSFPWPIRPWKKDGKNIVVCPPSNAMKGRDKNGGYIVTGKDNIPPSPLIDWDDTYAVVTYNSNISLEATTRGIPCFTDVHNACAPISETDFSKIETPKYPDREPLYYSMAYGQFTAEEMRNGYAWGVLDGR
jgi:hypothetical protein